MDRKDFINKIQKVEEETCFQNIYLNNYEFRSATSSVSEESKKMLMGMEEKNYCLNDFSFRQFLTRTGLDCATFTDPHFIASNADLVSKVINQVLEGDEDLYSNAYIRNNEILAAHSKNYKPLPISELINTLESELQRQYKDFTFECGFYSDEFTIVDYSISDYATITAYKKALNLEDYDVKVVIRFVTSNLGLSGANLYPFVMYKRKGTNKYAYVPASSKVITLKHEGEASLEKFRNNAHEMFALTETLPEKLNELKNITIQYPTHCCINLAERVGIPAKYITEVAENVAFVYPNRSINGLQLYMLFAHVIQQTNDEKLSFALSEKVAKGIRVLRERTSEIDIPKIKWKRLQNITAEEGQDFIPNSEPEVQMSFLI